MSDYDFKNLADAELQKVRTFFGLTGRTWRLLTVGASFGALLVVAYTLVG